MLSPGTQSEAKCHSTLRRRILEFEEVRDVSSYVHDGTLTWDPLPGEWEILRIGYTDSDARVSTASGEWQGLAIDYMSRDAFKPTGTIRWNRCLMQNRFTVSNTLQTTAETRRSQLTWKPSPLSSKKARL